MTSPSETPLDLDHVKALADMRAAARSARSELAKGSTKMRLIGGMLLDTIDVLIAEVERLRERLFRTERFQYADCPRAHVEDRTVRPRTVGDLTARDLGRRVRIDGGRVFAITSLEAYGREYQVILGWALNGYVYAGLDTPVEFLDDEPANAHQRPGERLPSHERAAQVLGDPETAEGAL